VVAVEGDPLWSVPVVEAPAVPDVCDVGTEFTSCVLCCVVLAFVLGSGAVVPEPPACAIDMPVVNSATPVKYSNFFKRCNLPGGCPVVVDYAFIT
jgi:hypothetical protein